MFGGCGTAAVRDLTVQYLRGLDDSNDGVLGAPENIYSTRLYDAFPVLETAFRGFLRCFKLRGSKIPTLASLDQGSRPIPVIP